MNTNIKFAEKKLLRKKSLKVVSILALTAMLTTACTTYDPYTRDAKTSKATKGAVIGAVSGAVIGAITGDDSRERRKRALIGAGVGGLTGGGIGYYMDVQEAKLREKLEGTGVSVSREGDNIVLNMPGNITFATDSSDINGNFYNVLDSVTLVLNEYNQTVVELAGHTDSTGSDSYNQELSVRRAGTVAGYLYNKGIDELRLMAIGHGERRPVADNSTDAGRQMNRRVELTLVPVTEDG